MRVATVQSNHNIQIEERPLPQIGLRELLLQVRACGICGTDILKVQKQSVPVGTVLGHEVAGVVSNIGKEVTRFKNGDRVVVAHHVPCGDCHFCRHENFSMCPQFRSTNLSPGGFAEYLRIPAEHLEKTAFKIPDSVTFEEASFMEPVACCLRAVRRSRLLPGDQVLVIGIGSIGLILVQLFAHFGMKVSCLDLVPERELLAKKYGATPFDKSDKADFDMVLLTGGTNSLMAQSFNWVRDGGKIHLFSSLHQNQTESSLDLNQIYHRELEILSTYSSSPGELEASLQLIAEGKIDVKNLISSRLPLNGVQEGIEKTVAKKILKAVIIPNATESVDIPSQRL